MLHLYSKTDDLAQLVTALLPNTACGLAKIPVTGLQETSTFDTQQRHELAALAWFKAVNTSTLDDTLSDLRGPIFEGTRLKSLELARSDIHLFQKTGDDGRNRGPPRFRL